MNAIVEVLEQCSSDAVSPPLNVVDIHFFRLHIHGFVVQQGTLSEGELDASLDDMGNVIRILNVQHFINVWIPIREPVKQPQFR